MTQPAATVQAAATVIVIDDDPAMREALDCLLRSVGMTVRPFDSVQAFLDTGPPQGPCCLVLDVRLPGQSGLDLQDLLTRSGVHIPIIFITGHADVPMTVRAMKAGAVEFLEKPFREQGLLDAIQVAIEKDRTRRDSDAQLADLRQKQDRLTARERQIMPLVTAGLLNKQIAARIGVSEITVKVHRGQVMRKMSARSLAELVRMADRLGISPQPQ
jgi:FixJ family two-component response regulator